MASQQKNVLCLFPYLNVELLFPPMRLPLHRCRLLMLYIVVVFPFCHLVVHCLLGIFFVLPCIESYQKVDLRTITLDVPPQEVKHCRLSNRFCLGLNGRKENRREITPEIKTTMRERGCNGYKQLLPV